MIERCVIIVLDSVGIGALPDAWQYGDVGSDTLGNLARAMDGLKLPNMEALGLGCIRPLKGLRCPTHPQACFGRMAEASVGKDTTVGHWEMAGVITREPFPTYPNGFPEEVIKPFEDEIGRLVLGNKPASGTVIIEELGQQHLDTGYPIVYTSADSVFQIAAHEKVIPVEELYRICCIARSILQGKHGVARVIARPFIGSPGSFTRTSRRKDFGLEPQGETLLDRVKDAGMPVVGIGKIGDIFAHRGLTEEIHTEGNLDGMAVLRRCLERVRRGLIFANLVDFDMLYAHRNNVEGFAEALVQFDGQLESLVDVLGPADVLFITADHGGDPTTISTDHAREYVPLLVHGCSLKVGVDLGTRETFADLGATVAEFLGVGSLAVGESFAQALIPTR